MAAIEDVKIIDKSPKLIDESLKIHLPTRLFPERAEITIRGVSNAVSNGIRRTIACELPVLAMIFNYEALTTTDPFIIPEMIIERFKQIPILQTCPRDATFKLTATNNTTYVRNVYSSEIQIATAGSARIGTYGSSIPLKKPPFNETFILLTLKPSKSIEINNIRVNQSYGSIPGGGAHVLAVHASSVALDQEPVNMYKKINGGVVGISSSISNPRKWRISFDTIGSMPAYDIVLFACENIIARVKSVKELLHTISMSNNTYILVILGETDTIGNLFVKTITELFPNIALAVWFPSILNKKCTIRIRCEEDINIIYNNTINHLVKIFEDIKKEFMRAHKKI